MLLKFMRCDGEYWGIVLSAVARISAALDFLLSLYN